MKQINHCLGCQLSNHQLPTYIVYENEYVTCILDHAPFNSGHTLILPKQHNLDVEELDSSTSNAIMDASKLISKALKLAYHPDGITICQNGGIFNELTHYHMHVIPRYEGQSFAKFYSENEDSLTTDKPDFKTEQSKIKEAIKTVKNLTHS